MIRKIAAPTFAVALLLAAACDPSAKAKGEESAAASGERSKEYQSCGATAHCESGLHCADGICRSPDVVIIGDYWAAVGRRALAAGEHETAAKAFGEAVNQYKADNREPPLVLYCQQGHALVPSRDNTELAELAARVLHRCARLAPVGSALRTQALDDLAALREVGLDPLLLATDEADKYLTKEPVGPDREDIKLTIASTISSNADSFEAFKTTFGGPAMRTKLLPCWEKYAEAAGSESLAMTFRFKYRFVRGVYESQDGYKLSMDEASAGGDPALTAALACATPILEKEVESFEEGSGRWDGDVTISLSP